MIVICRYREGDSLAGSSMRLIMPATVAQDLRMWNSNPSFDTRVTKSDGLFSNGFVAIPTQLFMYSSRSETATCGGGNERD